MVVAVSAVSNELAFSSARAIAGRLTTPAMIKPTVHAFNFILIISISWLFCCRRTRRVGLKKHLQRVTPAMARVVPTGFVFYNRLSMSVLRNFQSDAFPLNSTILDPVGQISPLTKHPPEPA